MEFRELGLSREILKAIDELGYTEPSLIQTKAIPVILNEEDVLGSALTGTGKTAAFAIPILEQLIKRSRYGERANISVLVLVPTRELAEQIKDSFISLNKHLQFKIGAIYGGVNQRRQEVMLERGIDVLVATPGRLLDLMTQKIVNLNNVQTFVLDEADTMLDMGFINDVKAIYKTAKQVKQTLMFSATIKNDVESLAAIMLRDPKRIATAKSDEMLQTITHTFYLVDKTEKRDALLTLLSDRTFSSVLIFTRTKMGANRLNTFLLSYGVKSDVIHGNKSQAKRQNALNSFKAHKLRVLVATDIAARGIDIDTLSHVINFDLPISTETYVHRIGRTGRAGLTGHAISFCMSNEKAIIKALQKGLALQINIKELPDVKVEDALIKIPDFNPAPRPNFQAQKQKQKSPPTPPQKQKRTKVKTKKSPLVAEALSEDKRVGRNTKIRRSYRKKGR